MKILSGLMLFVLLGVTASGQQAASPKVIAEIAAASSDRVVKGAPFSAEAVSESVQMLADGNRIVRSSTSKLYRNSEGRFRREMFGGSGNLLGTTYSFGQGISILDPVVGNHYLLDSALKTATVTGVRSVGGVSVAGTIKGDVEKAIVAEKLLAANARAKVEGGVTSAGGKGELEQALMAEKLLAARANAETHAVVASGQNVAGHASTIISASGGQGFAYTIGGSHSKYESRTEQLGTQNIEGVNAEGTRTITTIPAGAIGNERPIEIIYEKWYSKELDMVVMSKNSDPRFGEQTYRLTNIVRSEPDPSLFSLPTGYKVLTQPGASYRFSTTKAEAVKAATKTVSASKP